MFEANPTEITIQPNLDVEIHYPRPMSRSLEEIAVYHSEAAHEALIDQSDQLRFGQVILASEQFWVSRES